MLTGSPAPRKLGLYQVGLHDWHCLGVHLPPSLVTAIFGLLDRKHVPHRPPLEVDEPQQRVRVGAPEGVQRKKGLIPIPRCCVSSPCGASASAERDSRRHLLPCLQAQSVPLPPTQAALPLTPRTRPHPLQCSLRPLLFPPAFPLPLLPHLPPNPPIASLQFPSRQRPRGSSGPRALGVGQLETTAGDAGGEVRGDGCVIGRMRGGGGGAGGAGGTEEGGEEGGGGGEDGRF